MLRVLVACVRVQMVHTLLLNGKLPLSSLQLVAGKCLSRVYKVDQPPQDWSYNIEKAAVCVLEGSAGYQALLDKGWAAAGLKFHVCQVRMLLYCACNALLESLCALLDPNSASCTGPTCYDIASEHTTGQQYVELSVFQTA